MTVVTWSETYRNVEYVLVDTDADAALRWARDLARSRHWFVVNVTKIRGTTNYTVKIRKGR